MAPGQILAVTALVEHAPFVRAVARAAMPRVRGTSTSTTWTRTFARRSSRAPRELLDWSPPWKVTRCSTSATSAAQRCRSAATPSRICSRTSTATAWARDAARADGARGRMMLDEQLINWTSVSFPNAGWAETIFGEPDVERLWELLAFTVRLDEPDPVAAWREHLDRLTARAAALNGAALRRAALPRRRDRPDDRPACRDANFEAARFHTSWDREHVPNMPTEEVVRRAGLSPHRGRRSLDPAARSAGPARRRARAALRRAAKIVDVKADAGADVVRGARRSATRAPS